MSDTKSCKHRNSNSTIVITTCEYVVLPARRFLSKDILVKKLSKFLMWCHESVTQVSKKSMRWQETWRQHCIIMLVYKEWTVDRDQTARNNCAVEGKTLCPDMFTFQAFGHMHQQILLPWWRVLLKVLDPLVLLVSLKVGHCASHSRGRRVTN